MAFKSLQALSGSLITIYSKCIRGKKEVKMVFIWSGKEIKKKRTFDIDDASSKIN